MPSRFAAIAFLAASLYGAGAPAPQVSRTSGILRSLPVRFEENRGQWAPEVKFVARTGAYNLSLTANGAIVAAAGKKKQVAVSFPGSRPAGVEGAEPYPFRTNYFLGNRKDAWQTGVTNYSRVRYREVYPGTDVVYYGNGEQLEYDFALKAGADPARIRMEFRGADRVSLTDSGDLAIEAGDGRLLQKRPTVYQQDSGGRREVAAHYKMLGANLVGLELGDYDRTRELTVDPVLYYGTLVGGTGTDSVISVKTDATGYVYVLGYTNVGDIGPSGYYQANSGGAVDAFVAKFDPNVAGPASMAYFTYIGGSGDDRPGGMALDKSGNVYIVGTTTSTNFPVSTTAAQAKRSGEDVTNQDVFVLKLNTLAQGAGALVYSSYLGGAGNDTGTAIDIDSAGAIYIGGTTMSEPSATTATNAFPFTAGARAKVKWGAEDAFFAKFDPSQSGAASMPYASYIGGEADEEITAIAVAPDGKVYMAGNTTSLQYPLAGSFAFGPQGSVDIFISRLDFNATGFDSVPYTTMFGGTGVDQVKSMVVDPQGRLVLAGYTLSADFPTTPGALSNAQLGNAGNAFVSRLDLSKFNIVDYSTYLGGSGGDVAYGVAADTAGNILVTGYTLSPDFPVTGDATQAAYTGGVNAFLTVFSPATPGVKFSTFLGQAGVHTAYTVAAGANGRIYVGGSAGQAKVPLTDSAFKASFAGGAKDGFLLVFNP